MYTVLVLCLLLHFSTATQQLRYSGRHYIEDETIKFVWSSTGVSCRVQNTTTVSVNISIPHQGLRLRVKLNDTKWISTLDIPKNKHQKQPLQQIIVLVNNLNPKYTHTVQFMKVTEIDVNSNKHKNDLATSFHNFVLDNRHSTFVAVPPFSNRRLEFIGDSDTAGYCVDGFPNGNDNQNKVQDSTKTWAWQLANGLNVSDVQVEAISGWGVTSYSSTFFENFLKMIVFVVSTSTIKYLYYTKSYIYKNFFMEPLFLLSLFFYETIGDHRSSSASPSRRARQQRPSSAKPVSTVSRTSTRTQNNNNNNNSSNSSNRKAQRPSSAPRARGRGGAPVGGGLTFAQWKRSTTKSLYSGGSGGGDRGRGNRSGSIGSSGGGGGGGGGGVALSLKGSRTIKKPLIKRPTTGSMKKKMSHELASYLSTK